MKTKMIVILGVMVSCISACTNKQEEHVIAYGTEVKLEDYFTIKAEESITTNVTINSQLIGIYDVTATITNSDQTTREEKKQLTVKDEDPAEIQFIQPIQVTYEIPFQASYNPIGNIDKIADKVDGEYKEIDIVTSETYENTIKAVKEAKIDALNQVFTSDEQIETYQKKRLRNGYTLVTNDVNVNVAGTYTVQIATIDNSFNLTEKRYQVKVVNEGETVEDTKLAAGTAGTKMGGASAYTINNKTTAKQNDQEADTTTDKNDTSLPANNAQSQQKFEANIVSDNTITAQGSPVLQAALNYVGAHMMCDELATMALVDGGYLTGTAERIFREGDHYCIGVYQFPKIGTYISESEAVPGDLILYDDGGYGSMHIAVYAGNGKAVHGGYNGANVVISTVYLGSGPRYFRVSPMTWSDVSMKIWGTGTDENGEIIWPDTGFPNTSDHINDAMDIPNGNDDPVDDDAWIDDDITYVSTLTVNDISITISSPTPIDYSYAFAQLELYIDGQITMDEMSANLAAMGYTIIG